MRRSKPRLLRRRALASSTRPDRAACHAPCHRELPLSFVLSLVTAALAVTLASFVCLRLERRMNPERTLRDRDATIARLVPTAIGLADDLRAAPLLAAGVVGEPPHRRAVVRVALAAESDERRRDALIAIARVLARTLQARAVIVEGTRLPLHPDLPSPTYDQVIFTPTSHGWDGEPVRVVVAYRVLGDEAVWSRAALEGTEDLPGPGWFAPVVPAPWITDDGVTRAGFDPLPVERA
jgi:hypothetical protein